MSNAGIDYGHGLTNINLNTGIRYGIININKISEWSIANFEPVYNDEDNEDPSGWKFEDDDYTLELDEQGDIWVFRSPYYTTCKFCSPCAPGAGDLSAPIDSGVATYCLGPEWFEDEVEPYVIYNVSNS